MAERSVSEQIINGFIENVEKAGIIDKAHLVKLKAVLDSDKTKKVDILEAIGGREE